MDYLTSQEAAAVRKTRLRQTAASEAKSTSLPQLPQSLPLGGPAHDCGTAAKPNIVLPLVVDEVTTWQRIQPGFAQIMRARGAIPVSYADMSEAYPDLFVSREAAKHALERENPGQTPIEEFLKNPGQTPKNKSVSIGVWHQFSVFRYRRPGSRGPCGRLLYDATRIDPLEWLRRRFGDDVAVVL